MHVLSSSLFLPFNYRLNVETICLEMSSFGLLTGSIPVVCCLHNPEADPGYTLMGKC